MSRFGQPAGGPDRGDELGKLPRALLSLLLPAARRDEFIGDLLEEARQRATRHGDAHARRWLWRQVFASFPSLVVARLRRLPLAGAVAVAVPTTAAASLPVVFGGGLLGARARGRRSLAVTVSVMLHALVLLAAAVRGMWGVDELTGPQVVITLWNGLPVMPPLFEPAAGGSSNEPQRPEQRLHRRVRQTPNPLLAALTPEPIVPTSGSGSPPGAETGSGQSHGTAPACPDDHPDCNDDPPPVLVLPPKVGEKSCVSCPLPRLPPAFTRFGTVQSILMRICVDAAGRVVSTNVLSGIGGTADEGVAATVAGWRFSPYAVDGRPVPFCYVSRFVFTPG
jgi:hypothetical protein